MAPLFTLVSKSEDQTSVLFGLEQARRQMKLQLNLDMDTNNIMVRKCLPLMNLNKEQ